MDDQERALPSPDKGTVVNFHKETLARLRANVEELGADNKQLLRYVRSHSSLLSQVHRSALKVIDAVSFDHLVQVITQDWVDVLEVDVICLAMVTDTKAFRYCQVGILFADAGDVGHWFGPGETFHCAHVEEGAPIFGAKRDLVRSEILMQLDLPKPLPQVVLAIGTHKMIDFEAVSDLLKFLGEVAERRISHILLSIP